MANKTKASSYPITFPYGARDGYYYAVKGTRNSPPPYGDGKISRKNGIVGAYHRGDDRKMPVGCDVIVNKTKIGDSGSSGSSSGPHLHIQRLIAGVHTNPRGKGFTMTRGPLGRPTVIYVGYDNARGHFVRVRSGYGANYEYCHLNSKPLIKVGTKL